MRTVAGHVLVSGRLLAHETRGGNTALHIQCGEARTFVFETRALEGVVLQVDYWIRALYPPHSQRADGVIVAGGAVAVGSFRPQQRQRRLVEPAQQRVLEDAQ